MHDDTHDPILVIVLIAINIVTDRGLCSEANVLINFLQSLEPGQVYDKNSWKRNDGYFLLR